MMEAAAVDMGRLAADVRTLAHLVGRLNPERPAPDRKYTAEEAGWRLVCGRDPATLTEAERAGIEPLSARTVDRLVACGHIARIRIGRSSYISEQSIRNFEASLACGAIDGYRVRSRKKLKK